MRPPALEIRLILPAPRAGWSYLAKLKGEAVSEGEGYAKPGDAFAAALVDVKAAAADRLATTEDEGADSAVVACGPALIERSAASTGDQA